MKMFNTIARVSVALVAVVAATGFVSAGTDGLTSDKRPAELDPLAIGAAAPLTNLQFMTVAGEPSTLQEERGEQGLLVVFTCNTCPWVSKWEDRYEIVTRAAREAGLGVVMLNSNAALRDGDESLESMKARAAASGYTFAYAVDPESALADAFGATRTPEAFLFNAEMRLFYHGAIDDNVRDASEVETPFLMDAINAYKAGKPVPLAETNSIGCTIKRKRG